MRNNIISDAIEQNESKCCRYTVHEAQNSWVDFNALGSFYDITQWLLLIIDSRPFSWSFVNIIDCKWISNIP